jgi:hypothetical protein
MADPALRQQRRVTGHYARFVPESAWLQATPAFSVENRPASTSRPRLGPVSIVEYLLCRLGDPGVAGVEGKLELTPHCVELEPVESGTMFPRIGLRAEGLGRWTDDAREEHRGVSHGPGRLATLTAVAGG